MDTPGVVVAPPRLIAESLKAHVEQAMDEIPPGKSGALIGVATDAGINLAVAARIDDRWQVAAWIGKNWHAGASGGAYVKATW